jgi:ABC-type multidrug transport system fused ATPase/permease subunit
MLSMRKTNYIRCLLFCMKLLSKSDKSKLLKIMIVQCFLLVLDLVGLAIVGLLASISISEVVGQESRGIARSVVLFFNLENFNLQEQVLIFSFSAVLFFTIKSLFSLYFSRKMLLFMGRKSAEISSLMLLKVIGQPLQRIQQYSVQETIYLTTSGVSRIFSGIFGTTLSLFIDSFSILILVGGIVFIDPLIGFSTVGLFLMIGISLYMNLRLRALKLGQFEAEKSIILNQLTNEVLNSYRELVVKNRRFFYANEIGKERIALSDISSELSFMQYIGKYIMEIALVIGVFAVAFMQFVSQDLVRSLSVIALFIAASSRIAPSALRIQQNFLTIKSNVGGALQTIDLINRVEEIKELAYVANEINISHIDFESSLRLSNLSLTYPNNSIPTIVSLSLKIDPGEFVAIVGPSGAGKSTLVDLILGILVPDSGEVVISGKSPLSAINKWPGAIGYVPQETFILQGTIRENITMGFPKNSISNELIWEALERANLSNFVKSLPQGLDHQVGDNGAFLSGGQRQRLGIARSLLTKPKILILDESTSSLDLLTEYEISQSLQNDKGKMTIVMVAHRLSTIRHADKIVYLEQGKILSVGKFDQVCKDIPNFKKQIQILEN